MEPNSSNPNSVPAATSGSRSKLLSTNFKNFLSKPAITHPQKALTVQLWNAEQKSNAAQKADHDPSFSKEQLSTAGHVGTGARSGSPKLGGEQVDARDMAMSEDSRGRSKRQGL